MTILFMRLFTLASAEERWDGFYEDAAPPLICLFRRNMNLRQMSWKIRTPHYDSDRSKSGRNLRKIKSPIFIIWLWFLRTYKHGPLGNRVNFCFDHSFQGLWWGQSLKISAILKNKRFHKGFSVEKTSVLLVERIWASQIRDLRSQTME